MESPADSNPSMSTSNLNSLGQKSRNTIHGSGKSISPDVVFKMSKKIAQLTKVIYYLNTKHEDHALEIQALVDAYEIEIQDVARGSEQTIQEYQLQFQENEMKLQAQEDILLVSTNDEHGNVDMIHSNSMDLEQCRADEGVRSSDCKIERVRGRAESVAA